MNLLTTTIIPVTKARPQLGSLTKKVIGNKYFVLTKGGKPEAALVDIKYLSRLEEDLAKIYQKTFIDPKLLPFTREFTPGEIAKWEKEDRL